ncbi:MAG: hypothetical protein JJT78_17965, partial [Leptospira sp.]|nr:hypothetical protein [Leptospira sp.]
MSDSSAKKIFNQAVKAEKDGDMNLAEKLYYQSIEKDGSFVTAWLNLGSLLFRSDKKSEGIKALKQALKL